MKNKFHVDLVTKAVLTYAFPRLASLDVVTNLPFKEPPFRHARPGALLTTATDESDNATDAAEQHVLISKKPEGQREILVGIVDRVDKHFYVYSMCRNKMITFVHPDDPALPVPTSADLQASIHRRSMFNRQNPAHQRDLDQIAFVFDVCRVYHSGSRRFFNVVLSDVSPMSLPAQDKTVLAHAYFLRTKVFRPYTCDEDIRAIMDFPEDYPYHPDNGVVFVQTPVRGSPDLRSPCAKFTPHELSTVFLHVNPIISLKTRVWQLCTWRNDNLEPFRFIPAPNFYVPPTGAIVAFRIVIEGERWRLVPTRMRVDKATPSSSLTLTKFIARNLPKSMQKQTHNHRDKKTMAMADSDNDDVNPDEGVASAGAGGAATAAAGGGEELNAFA
jgi:hypothetical protein